MLVIVCVIGNEVDNCDRWFECLPVPPAPRTDMVEGDPDADCRSLAAQALALLERSLRASLEIPAEAPQA